MAEGGDPEVLMRSLSEDADFDDEMKLSYGKYGVEGLLKKIDAWKNQPVKIAVTGSSGCGKSSFINRVRGLTPDDEVFVNEAGEEVDNPMYAAVGVTETTTQPRPYVFPENPQITIWDLPGANTAKFPIGSYAEKMNFKEFHALIILTKDRFYETDKEIARQIRELSKPFFFARTQMDTTMKNEAEDRGRRFNEEETKEMIRKNCREELDDPEQEVYLISKKSPITVQVGKKEVEITFPDNHLLKMAVLDSLQGIQRTALVLSLKDRSQGVLDAKVEELKKRIPWIAAASFAGGAIPVPGASILVDIPLLVNEARFQRKQLMIDDADMKRNAEEAGTDETTYMKKVGDAIAQEGVGVFLTTSVRLTTVIGTQLALSEGISEGLKFIPVVGTVIGSVVGAATSGTMSYVTLKKMLDAHKVISETSLQVLSAMKAKSAVVHRSRAHTVI